MGDAALNVKQFPRELMRRLKIAAATDGQTLREFVIGTLEKSVESVKLAKPAKK